MFAGLDTSVRQNATPSERGYREVKRRILTCRLAPGDLVNERTLAKEIGIPRTVLHESCLRLVPERLVCPAKGGAFTVAGFNPEEIREICEMRQIVESKAAALAAERARPHEVARLLILAELTYRPGDRRTYVRYLLYNTAFHQQLAHAARNSRLEATVASLLDEIQRPLYLGLDIGIDPGEATAEHLALVDAVRRKRPALAYRTMWKQLAATEKRILSAFADNSFSSQPRKKAVIPFGSRASKSCSQKTRRHAAVASSPC